jgi:hypothetical protein
MIHPYAYALDDEKTRKLSAMLDDFHDAAAKADSQRYFAHFARHATFLGTDATECWGMSEFKAFAKPYFDSGKGWTYTLVPGTRNFYRLDSEGDIVAFDELLDNAKLGQCRGSGVIQFGKIVQYNLTMTIPNDIAEDVAKQSRAHLEAPRK